MPIKLLSHLFVVFAFLFPHTTSGPSAKAVLAFTQTSSDTLHTYEDGSAEAVIEQPTINQIQHEIDFLAEHPRSPMDTDLMRHIFRDLNDLYALDNKIAQDEESFFNQNEADTL